MPLQNDDNLIVGRGSDNFKLSYEALKDQLSEDIGPPKPVGDINQPTVLEPNDGAGGGGTTYPKTEKITAISGGGVSTCETDTIQSVTTSVYRVGYPDPAELGQNNSSLPALVPVSAADIDDCDVRTFTEGQGWEEGSTGSLPGYQRYLIVDQGVSGPATIYLNQDMTGASYSLFVSDTGKTGTWTFAGTIQPTTGPMVGTESGRYVCFVRNANGDSIGVTDQSQTPDQYSAPLYFTTPAVDVTLTFPSSNGFDCFEVGDVVQLDDNYLSGPYVSESTQPAARGGDWNNVFNGVIGTTGSDNDMVSPSLLGETCVFTPSTPIPVSNSVKIYSLNEFEGAIVLNDDVTFAATVAYGAESIIPASELGGYLRKVTVVRGTPQGGGTGGYLAGIKVDDRLLVDPSVATGIDVNEAKVISKDENANTITVDGGTWGGSVSDWSSQGTLTNNNPGTGGYENVFNGVTREGESFAADALFSDGNNWYADGTQNQDGNGTVTGINWAFNSKVELAVWYSDYAGTEATLEINGTSVISGIAKSSGANATVIKNDVTSLLPNGTTAITTLKLGRGAGTSNIGLYGIYLDGKLLIDSGKSQDKLVKETPYDTQLTVDGSTNLSKMEGAVIMTNSTGDGPYTLTPYKLTTSQITNVGGEIAGVPLNPPDQVISMPLTNISQWLLDEGITQITGVVFDVYQADGYSTELREFTINEVSLRGSGRTITSQFGEFSGLSTPEGWINGEFILVQASGPAGGRAGFTFDPVDVVGTTQIEFVATRANVYLLDQNGIEHLAFGHSDNSVLTFEDNKDLEYFLSGDVIANDSITVTTSSGTFDANRTPNNLFDGSNGSYCADNNPGNQVWGGQYLQVEFNPPVAVQGKLTFGFHRTDNYVGVSINGGAYQGPFDYTSWDANFAGDLSTLKFSVASGNRKSSCSSISIDDTMLVFDGVPETYSTPVTFGSFGKEVVSVAPDNSKMTVNGGNWVTGDNTIWSSTTYCISGAEGNGVYSSDRAFNGETIGEQVWYAPLGGGQARFVTSGLFSDATEVTICYSKNGNASCFLNDVDVSSDFPAGADQTKTISLTDGFESFKFDYPSSGNYFGLCWIKIDGVLLQDGNPDAANFVEYQTNGGKGEVVKVDTVANTVLLKGTGDKDNRWIKDFFVAGPVSIDDPLLTNDVQLRGSDFATTPADVDTLKEIIWSINGVEYSAGVTNPWSPLEKLPTDSTVTVKVKYKGNVLDDSEWSPTISFTTGATLRSLFTRIAALEANDVTDDATDTALLTLIAGLAQRIQALEESN